MLEKKLDTLKKRYDELGSLLSSAEVANKPELLRQYSMEHSRLVSIIELSNAYAEVKKEIAGLNELKNSSDDEMKALANAEHPALIDKLKNIESELKIALLPVDPNADKNVIVEIRAGTGGEESALFAGELFRMYCRYAEMKKWEIEIMDSNPTGLGGFKEVVFGISGAKVWSYLKFERGTHRVQRVPETEASGRVHTSAITVAVLPEADEVDIEIKTEDLRIDTYRASGAGGQHINKTDSAIRITHIPTNIVVSCQDERSQIKNRAKAMKVLRSKLLEAKMLAQEQAIMKDRRQQVGSGDRSEKIRTYNYPQNRITDHRINLSLYNLKEVLEGELDDVIGELIKADQEAQLNDNK